MMPSNRLYLDPTASPMVQARGKMLSGLLKHQLYNMRGNSSFLLIITPKDKIQAFKNAETCIQIVMKLDLKGISQNFLLS